MNREEVEKIARLARIELTDEETEALKKQFADILAYVKQVDELDLSDTEPVSHPFDITNVFREDKSAPCLGAEELLKIAPASGRSMIRVPKVIDR